MSCSSCRRVLRAAVLAVATCLLLPAAHATAPADPAATAACTDFDAHVNGRWEATAVLPPERARIGSFDTLRRANDRLLEDALTELAASPEPPATPGLRLLGAYYRSGMDTAAIEQRGLSAVQPWLDRIGRAEPADLPRLLGEMARLQVAAPFGLFVNTDARDATRHALLLVQGGLGLPDRDDYAGDDERSRRLRDAYRSYARRLLEAAALPADASTLDALMAFETTLAQASLTRAQRRDPTAAYNPHTPATLQALAPGVDWAGLLQAYTGRAGGTPLIVAEPAFAGAAAALLGRTPAATWQTYLRVRLLDATAEHLPQALAQAHFDYRQRAIRGLQAPPTRVDSVIQHISGTNGSAPLAQALGELFVQRAFSPRAQQRALAMLADIKAAMHSRIDGLAWMSAPTKALAQAKLDAMVAKIGAPAQWPDYAGLALQPDDHAGNLLRVQAWRTAQRLADLDRPVDRQRWNTSPHIVNAFAGGGNQIVFPAGILQPPFFDENADDASNYGGIGMVIGHEITHHFDDRGRQFDAVGNLRDWWQPADASAYKARADRVAALYGGYEPLPGVRIDGRLTLGENISDMAGVQIAYEGLQRALARQRSAGQAVPLVDGLTPEQRFFTSVAVVWRGKMRTEALLDQLRTDSHSPGRFRVLAPLTHAPAFAQAFGCKPGDAMVAADPVVVW